MASVFFKKSDTFFLISVFCLPGGERRASALIYKYIIMYMYKYMYIFIFKYKYKFIYKYRYKYKFIYKYIYKYIYIVQTPAKNNI